MKAYSCSSGGVMFVEDEIERATNKAKSKSYKDIAGADEKKSIRDKIFGVFKIEKKHPKVA